MSQISSTPFFTVAWEPPITAGLSPAHPSQDDHPFMTVAWAAKPGTTFYPWAVQHNGQADWSSHVTVQIY
jgi:hypothetical protein